MIKSSTLSLLFFITFFSTFAQTPLPYYSGFDNASQQNGWQEFRTGYQGTYNWGYAGVGAHTAPTGLSHDNPVGSASTDTTIDWFVSPGFDFSAGGHLDSIWASVYSITGSATAIDYFGVYLLQGAANPANATTKTELVNLTGWVSSSNAWKDTSNITIPPTAGTSYIALRYRATNNWFVINADDIRLSGNATGIEKEVHTIQFRVYPNPATERIDIESESATDLLQVKIIDMMGRIIYATHLETIDISNLPSGIYGVEICTEKGKYDTRIIKR